MEEGPATETVLCGEIEVRIATRIATHEGIQTAIALEIASRKETVIKNEIMTSKAPTPNPKIRTNKTQSNHPKKSAKRTNLLSPQSRTSP